MHARLTQRLQQLRAEFDAGQKMLAELEAKQTNLQQTLLRISGAIQVLEEELAKAAPPEADLAAAPAEAVAAPGYALPA